MKSPKNEITKKWNQQKMKTPKKTSLTLPSLVSAQTPPIPAATQEIFWSPLLHLDGGGDYENAGGAGGGDCEKCGGENEFWSTLSSNGDVGGGENDVYRC